jgi:small subunit ribosomal protein S20
MPNKDSAKKELRKTKKRVIANNRVKDTMKTMIKKNIKQVEAGEKQVAESFNQTIKAIDKAVKKGLIKKNNAARKKSRLQKKVNSLLK